MPIYNSRNYLRQSIQSVLAQSYQNFELIIIDDGSTDDSMNIIASIDDKRIKVFGQSNQGSSVARNLGLAKALGEYILFLDSDDLLVTRGLEILRANIIDNDIVFGGWEDFNDQGNTLNSKIPSVGNYDSLTNYFKLLPTVSTALIKRNQIRWDTSLQIWEVTKYFLENIIDKKAAYIAEVVTKIRQHNHAERISLKFDHFNYEKTAIFFIDCKSLLIKNKRLDEGSEMEIDSILLANAYGILKSKMDKNIAKKILNHVNIKLIKKYTGYSYTNIYGFVHLFKGFLGLYMFYSINYFLKRT